MKTIQKKTVPNSTCFWIWVSMLIVLLHADVNQVKGCQENQIDPIKTSTQSQNPIEANSIGSLETTEPVDRSNNFQEPQPSPTKEPAISKVASPEEARMLDEIMEIRERIGGGISEQLEGIIPADTGDAAGQILNEMSRQALERQLDARRQQDRLELDRLQTIRQQTAAPNQDQQSLDWTRNSNDRYANPGRTQPGQQTRGSFQWQHHANPGARFNQQVQQASGLEPTVYDPRSTQPAPNSAKPLAEQTVEKIRSAATSLEKAAADLEATGLYDQADRIRETARGLWKMARQ